MSGRVMAVHVNVAERVLEQVTAAAAKAVSSLHRPVRTNQGIEACEHCTSLHGDRGIVRWPCPTRKHAEQAGQQAGAIDTSVQPEPLDLTPDEADAFHSALTEMDKSPGERIADAIETEEHRIRRLTPGHDDWQSPEFRMGMLHAAAIVRAEP